MIPGKMYETMVDPVAPTTSSTLPRLRICETQYGELFGKIQELYGKILELYTNMLELKETNAGILKAWIVMKTLHLGSAF
jgi:hypothetical protein